MSGIIRNELMQTLYPDGLKCIVCGKEIHKTRYGVCDKCGLALNENYCLRCGRRKVGIAEYCGECSDVPIYFDEARSSVVYEGKAQSVVKRFKYGGSPYLARTLAQYMLDTLIATDWTFDCFTYVPMTKKRKRKRGYNQAELLAKALSDLTTTPCFSLIEKRFDTPNQARQDKQTRMNNVAGSFATVINPPDHVVIIDDVMTTGSTLSECAKVIKKSGAKVVYALTFASVPEHAETDRHVKNIADFRR